jgi:diamine N-acetyltransferase
VGFSLVGSADLPGSSTDGSDVELKRIYILSKFHGAGAGLKLMNLAIEYAQQHGFARLLLGVYAGNGRARAFYSKHGFIEIAERQFQVGNRLYDDVVLARALQSTHASVGFQANGGIK